MVNNPSVISLVFDAFALLLLGFLTGCLIVRKREKNFQNNLFFVLIISAFALAISDIPVALMESDLIAHTTSQLFGFQILNVIFYHLTPVALIFYVLVARESYAGMELTKRAILMVPIPINAILISLCYVSLDFKNEIDPVFDNAVSAVTSAFAVFYLIVGIRYASLSFYSSTRRDFAIPIAGSTVFWILSVILQSWEPSLRVSVLGVSIAILFLASTVSSDNGKGDALTGFYNRSGLIGVMRDCFNRKRKFRIDCYFGDNFKRVNSVFGTGVGDQVLRNVSKSISETYRTTNIARMRGDQFAVLVNEKEHAYQIPFEEILKEIPVTWKIGDYNVRMTHRSFSIESRGLKNCDEVFALMDYGALMLKKRGSTDEVMKLDETAIEAYQRSSQVEKALTRTISTREGLELTFQPIVTLKDGRLHSAECLSRLNDKDMGLLMPSEFIPLAESNGLIMEFDRLAREKLFRFLTDYNINSAGIDHLTINVSAIECLQDNFSTELKQKCIAGHINPCQVGIEITESATLDSGDILNGTIRAIHDEGFSVYLDDYGTGYSNLVRMISSPFEVIKLDKSILDYYSEIPERRTNLAQMVKMLHDMNKMVLCEGIETEEQYRLLCSCDVDYGQGFYISRPLFVDEFLKFSGIRPAGRRLESN